MQTKLIKHWGSKGYFVINLISITPIGLPDLLCIKPNHVVFVESKEKSDKLSLLQITWLNRLTILGFECYVNYDKWKVTKEFDTDLF